MKSFYTCSSANYPDQLVSNGASSIELSYVYEVDTPLISVGNEFFDTVKDAIEKVQGVLLEDMASITGMNDCVVFDDSWRRRNLMPKERGGTSIVGLSSIPVSEVDKNLSCSATKAPTNVIPGNKRDGMKGASAVNSGSFTDSNEFEFASLRESDSFTFVNDDALLDSRIDGKIGVMSSSVVPTIISPPDSFSPKNNQSDMSSAENIDTTEAFNFISTQSETVSRTSFSQHHDPLVTAPSSSLFSPRMITECTVIRGFMTFYTDNAAGFENLNARAIDALRENMISPTVIKEKFLNDVILGLRLLKVNDANEASTEAIANMNSEPGYISSIIGSSNESSQPLATFSSQMLIIGGLGILLFVLLGLAMYTYNIGSKRLGWSDDNSFAPANYSGNDNIVDASEGRSAFSQDDVHISPVRRETYGHFDNGDRVYINAVRGVEHFIRSKSGDAIRGFEHFMRPRSGVQTASCVGNDDVSTAADDDDDDCYSIHSIRSASTYHPVAKVRSYESSQDYEVTLDERESADPLRHRLRSMSSSSFNERSPYRSGSSSKLYNTKKPNSLFASASSRDQCDDDESQEREAYVHDDLILYPSDSETAGMEVSLRPIRGFEV